MIIDGNTGYTGGINLADEYINRKKRFGYWKDAGIRLTGNAVNGLTKLFLAGWGMAGKEGDDDYSAYMADAICPPDSKGYYITFGSGPAPMYQSPVAKNAIMNLINQAEKYIYITTLLMSTHKCTKTII